MTPSLETRDLTICSAATSEWIAGSCAFFLELTAIVGPNGAAKTNYFDLSPGSSAPPSGRSLIEGEDVTHLSAAQRTRLA
jgi:branched-chain amino acid transport system ATP-binding protein